MTILILGERNTNKTSISWNKAIRGCPPISTSLLKRSPQSPNSWGFGLVTPHHFDSTVAKPMRGGNMGHCRCVWKIANSLHHPEGFLKRWLQLDTWMLMSPIHRFDPSSVHIKKQPHRYGPKICVISLLHHDFDIRGMALYIFILYLYYYIVELHLKEDAMRFGDAKC